MDFVKSVVIKGELSASEDLTLDGQMEGSVTLPNHTLTIGPGANIKASVSAKAVVIMGAVTGNVTAGEKVEIEPRARSLAISRRCASWSPRRAPSRQSRDAADRFPSQLSDLMQRPTNS